MATSPQTVGFTSPYSAAMADQMQELARLQQQSQQLDLNPDPGKPNSAGAYLSLNFNPVIEEMKRKRLAEKEKVERAKLLDLQGKYTEEMSRQLKAWHTRPRGGQVPTEALTSEYESIRKLAQDEEENRRKRFDKLLEKSDLPSGVAATQAGDQLDLLQEPEKAIEVGGVLAMTRPGQNPRLPSNMGFDQETRGDGTLFNVDKFTGRRTTADQASRQTVNVGAVKADETLLVEQAKGLEAQREALEKPLPQAFRALASAEKAAEAGALQGPLTTVERVFQGVLREFGVSAESLPKLKNTETINSDMGRFVLQSIKATGTNPSNADREFAERTAGGTPLSKEGLLAVIKAARADLYNSAIQHNQRVDQMVETLPSAKNSYVRVPLRVGSLVEMKKLFEGFEPDPQTGYFMPTQRQAPVSPTQGVPSLEDLVKRYRGQ